MPRAGAEGRYRIAGAGRFHGRIGADILSFVQNQGLDAALVLEEQEVLRILYFAGGVVVGSDSNVIFERLSRILVRTGAIEEAEARTVLSAEEEAGTAVASVNLSPEVLRFGLERRAWEIGSSLPFMPRAHYVLVEGRPELAPLPEIAIAPMDLAMEGFRRYDEWRSGPRAAPAAPAPTPELAHALNGASPTPTAAPPVPPPGRGHANGGARG
jgi:hypothetical protein